MSFYSKITSLPFVKSIMTKAKPSKVATQVTKSDKIPFCHQYWEMAKKEGGLNPSNKTSVSMHWDLNGINHHFINSPHPEHMNQTFMNTGKTPRQMITLTDFEFKTLKPTEKDLKVFRCIGEKPHFFSEYKLYSKRLNIKKGDIIDMKEYAYATSDKSFANRYLANEKGITYEIDIPKGSKVSEIIHHDKSNEIVFPRSSKFECLGTSHTENGLHIKLKYLIPKEV